jgi:uncharacterized membrane protein
MPTSARKIETDFAKISSENHAALDVVPAPREISRDLNAAVKPAPSARDLTEKAYRAALMGFVAVPLVAGVDKFANVLTDWSQYLAPIIPVSLGVSPSAFMVGVGVLEIALGIGLALKPRVFADLFSVWLLAIVANLVIQGEAFDMALLNFGLAAGACALARLASARKIYQARSRDSLRNLRRI